MKSVSVQSLRSTTLFSAAALLLVACSGEPESNAGQQGMPPAPVTVSTLKYEAVEQRATYPARIRGSQEVEVRAQVTGILQEKRYTEGAYIEKGQTLFLIEPEPFELALQRATADYENAEVTFAQAEREWLRIQELYENNTVSQRDFEQARLAVQQAEAIFSQADAAKRDAERNLRYTRVESPISGYTGIETVSAGNLINNGAVLTSITQTQPAYVHFSVPESDAIAFRKLARGEQKQSQVYAVQVETRGYERSEYPATIEFIDPVIDPQTGQVQFRATVENAENTLIPGQFVRVSLTLREFNNAILVAEDVISQGPQGAQVYVVGENNSAEPRIVELGPRIQDQYVILSGLEEGERLIVNGHAALQPGAPIQIAQNTDNGNESN